MDLDMLKVCWQEESRAERYQRLDTRDVRESVQSASDDIKRDLRRRLRREMSYYYVPAISTLLVFADVRTGAGLVFAAAITLMVGVIMVVLWRVERRLATTPRDGSLRQVVATLLSGVEAASGAYLAAYVGVIGCGTVVMAAAIWWRTGVNGRLALAVAGVVLACLWALVSGRAYVTRMFGPYRAALANCLRELGEAG